VGVVEKKKYLFTCDQVVSSEAADFIRFKIFSYRASDCRGPRVDIVVEALHGGLGINWCFAPVFLFAYFPEISVDFGLNS
jgi:hypothetical protein